jgi:RNA-directed DNA polymerase
MIRTIEGKPETFKFLGFAHYCGKRRKDGAFIVWRETAKKRLAAKLQAIKMELKPRRHEPIPSVGAWLRQVTSGYYQYHAVPGNLSRLHLFRWRLGWVWCRALSRRSQRSRISWARLHRLVERWIPVPRVLHPYPMQRFDAWPSGPERPDDRR